MRIAIVNPKKCTPSKCNFECHTFCPKVRAGVKETVQLIDNLSVIDEELCIGCGICVNKCPFDAIDIINLPEMEENPVHAYGQNLFRLFNFPQPKKGKVIGILGPNGIGKTTILQILNGSLRPNLGKKETSEEEVIKRFKGTETQNYFKTLFTRGIKIAYKPQYVDDIPKYFNGKVKELLSRIDNRNMLEKIAKEVGIEKILDSSIKTISGGELQKVSIAATLLKDADYYFFDEPTSYLDIKERLKIASLIRELAEKGKGVFVVEHDLVILDYLADIIHIVYGKPAAYGVVSNPLSAKDGINIYLNGYIKEENVRFREYELKFMEKTQKKFVERKTELSWNKGKKSFDRFNLSINPGTIANQEIIGIVGANGTGKTTFVKILAGELKSDSGDFEKHLKISYKPQYLKREEESVLSFLSSRIDINGNEFRMIESTLDIKRLFSLNVSELSGGELQQVNITLCLCTKADIYLLDEPSAYLDVEQRINVAKIIKNVLSLNEKSAFIVDHDLMFLNYLSDKGMVFLGEPGIDCKTQGPMPLDESMNLFLKQVGVTFRQEETSKRPRANKQGSVKDREQKKSGKYFIN